MIRGNFYAGWNPSAVPEHITLGDVERYLAQLASHPRDCTCGRCVLAPRVTAQNGRAP